MILTIDVGNTNITLGAYREDTLCFVSRLATERQKMPDQYASDILNIFKLHDVERNAFSGSIISCVVPEITDVLISAMETAIGRTPMLIGPGIKTGLNILIDNPAQLGADMVASAVGALNEYPTPCFIADLGTASKITVLDENGSFCGGAIAAGIGISLNALSSRASLLPNISLQPPKNAIGRNTNDCMQSGAVFGAAAMIDGLVERFQEEMNVPVRTIVATGGLAESVVSHCKRDILYDDNLILKGLKVVYDKNIK